MAESLVLEIKNNRKKEIDEIKKQKTTQKMIKKFKIRIKKLIS